MIMSTVIIYDGMIIAFIQKTLGSSVFIVHRCVY